MKPLISIIVPIYRVEHYVRKCLDSICNQTYKNIEIILVDDGSPDTCGRICDEYAEKDNRIIVIHKLNGGLSDARNAGLKAMNGDYLVFVDSDDWLPDDSIEVLFRLLSEYRADMVIGSCVHIDEYGNKNHSIDNVYSDTKLYNRIEAIKDYCQHGCASWARLYKKEVHKDVFFPYGEINEDEAIVLEILSKCNRILTTEKNVYYYLNRSNSITTSSFSFNKLIWKTHCKDNYEYIKNNYPELENEIAIRYRESIVWSLSEIAISEDYKDYKNEIKDMLNDIKKNSKIFFKAPFKTLKESIRYYILVVFGFHMYRIYCLFLRKLDIICSKK